MKLSQKDIEAAYYDDGSLPDFSGCTFIGASGDMGCGYEESFLCYFEKDGIIYEAESSHCSCYGFSWNPKQVSRAYLADMVDHKAYELKEEIETYLYPPKSEKKKEEEKELRFMNFEQFEKLLGTKEKVSVVDSGVPQNTPIVEWIETPRSKAVRRWGYNAEQRVLGVQWIKADGSVETYLYNQISQWVVDNIKKSKSIGKTMKYETAYRPFTKVEG